MAGITDGPVPPYRWRRLAHDQEIAVRRARQQGTPVRALADRFGVSPRLVYRVLARGSAPVHMVELGGWRSRFEVGALGPVQVEPWRPVDEALV